jgi:TonB family protein
MIKTCTLFAYLSILLMAAAPSATSDELSLDGLVARARTVEQLWTTGTPPMGLRGEIQIPTAGGPTVTGQYSFAWASATQWREEIRFANYKLIRVGAPNGYWQENDLDYQPKIIFRLEELLHLERQFRTPSNLTFGKVKERKKDGPAERCGDVSWNKDVQRRLCFNEATETLSSVEFPERENNPDEVSRFEYREFRTIAGKLFPYEVRALNVRGTFAVFKVLQIAPLAADTSALFKPPDDGVFWDQCSYMFEPQLLNKVQPKYPEAARAKLESGSVWLYGVIEKDGMVSHITPIQRATPLLDDAAVKAVSQWRYKPASCNGVPIRKETSVSVTFSFKK